VTGASSGIGTATVRRLAADGASVALVARRRDRLDDVASAIRTDGGTALVLALDETREPAEDTLATFFVLVTENPDIGSFC
jgi:NADP-dependent 3-hydroxy acid dehydrogenase YdfG